MKPIQVIDVGTRRELAPGPAWAELISGDIVRLKRAQIPLFQLQNDIEGLILEPGETLQIQFVAFNEGSEYDLSVSKSNDNWDIYLDTDRTDANAASTEVTVNLFVPMDTKGIETCTVTIAASNLKNGRTVATFMMTLVADETPDIEADRIDYNIGIIQRLATVTSIGTFDNSEHYSRREAIFSVMVPPSGFVTELTIIYNGEEFSSKERDRILNFSDNTNIYDY